MTDSTSITGTKVGRGRRRLSQLWQVPVFLLGLAAMVGVAASAPWRQTPQQREFEAEVASLREGLANPGDSYLLVANAENLLLKLPDFPSREAEIHFLVGSAYHQQAQQASKTLAKTIWKQAEEHLEKSHALGVASADRATLKYRLGFTLYQQGKDPARALDLMMQSVEKGADHPLAGYQLLVQAYLQQTPPNLDQALAASQRTLDLVPNNDPEQVAKVRLIHADLQMRKEQYHDAFKTLEPLGNGTPPALRIKARLLQAKACKEDGNWDKAAGIWQQLSADAAKIDGGKARVQYELGWCYHRMKPPKHTETIRVWTDALALGGHAGQAAGLSLGEMRLSMGDKYIAQALVDWKHALTDVSTPADFKNPYIKLADVHEMFEHAIARFEEAQDPEKTQLVAELYRKLVPVGVTELRIARAAESFAGQKRDLWVGKVGEITEAEVAFLYRRAGEAFENAAKAGAEADRPEVLWRGIQCYLSAKDSAQAERILRQFVLSEKNEARVAEGWCILGDLNRSEGKRELAQIAYKKCLDYGSATPFAYRARYYLAVEKIETKQFKEARAILEQNLVGDGEPDRPSQEKSQYELASLLMVMKQYDEAQIHLKECARLYPENPNVLLARAQLGECFRKLAEKEMAKEKELSAKITLDLSAERRLQLEENVRHLRRGRIARLTEAVKVYEKLADDLELMAAAKPLSKLDEMLVRRALFGVGECYLDNEQFNPALLAFKKLQSKHRQSLEGLYACGRICNLVNVMREPARVAQEVHESAKESVRLLLEDVKSLPAEHEIFRQPDVPSREAWIRWGEDTQRKLLAPAKADPMLPAIR